MERVVFRVSKQFCMPSAEVSSGTKIKRDIGAPTTPGALTRWNCTPSIIDVDVLSTMELCKSCRVVKQVRKGSSPSQPPTAARLLRLATKLIRNSMESKTAEDVQSKNGDAQAVHRTTLSTELGVFDNPFASDLLPGYSVGHEFVKHIPQD